LKREDGGCVPDPDVGVDVDVDVFAGNILFLFVIIKNPIPATLMSMSTVETVYKTPRVFGCNGLHNPSKEL
jgi:hypothetical protein